LGRRFVVGLKGGFDGFDRVLAIDFDGDGLGGIGGRVVGVESKALVEGAGLAAGHKLIGKGASGNGFDRGSGRRRGRLILRERREGSGGVGGG